MCVLFQYATSLSSSAIVQHERIRRRDQAGARASVEARRLVAAVSTRMPLAEPSAVSLTMNAHVAMLAAYAPITISPFVAATAGLKRMRSRRTRSFGKRERGSE